MTHGSLTEPSRSARVQNHGSLPSGREGKGREGNNNSSICLSNWSARETPRMDGRYAAEISGGR